MGPLCSTAVQLGTYYIIVLLYHWLSKGIESLPQNSDFIIPLSLQPNVVDLRYFKLWIMFDQMIFKFVIIKGLQNQVTKIKGIWKFEFVVKT